MIKSSIGPSTAGSIGTGVVALGVPMEVPTPHLPKMLPPAFTGWGCTVTVVDTERRLGVEGLREGAGLCAGVL